MTNALLAALVVITALNTALDGAAKLLHYFWPKSKVTKEVDVIKSDVAEAESVVSKLVPPGKQSGRADLKALIVMAIIGLVAACSLSMSCTAAQKNAASNFGHCEETAAVKDMEGPVKNVADDFIAGKLDKADALRWLDTFATSYGIDTVGCAITFVEQFFAKSVSGSADTGAATDLYNEWLAKHQHTERDIKPGNSAVAIRASTFYGFEPQETEVTADGHVYIWHFGSDGVATYTEAQ